MLLLFFLKGGKRVLIILYYSPNINLTRYYINENIYTHIWLNLFTLCKIYNIFDEWLGFTIHIISSKKISFQRVKHKTWIMRRKKRSQDSKVFVCFVEVVLVKEMFMVMLPLSWLKNWYHSYISSCMNTHTHTHIVV